MRRVLLIGLALFALAQVVRPAKANPAIDQSLAIELQMQVDPKVAAILDRSCAD